MSKAFDKVSVVQGLSSLIQEAYRRCGAKEIVLCKSLITLFVARKNIIISVIKSFK
jgi:hypothetical protein